MAHSDTLERNSVLAFELSSKTCQPVNGDLLHGSALSPGTVRREAEATDGTACADAGRKHIVRIQVVTSLQVRRIKISSVLSILCGVI